MSFEEQARELCQKIAASTDDAEILRTIHELKMVLHEHFIQTRELLTASSQGLERAARIKKVAA